MMRHIGTNIERRSSWYVKVIMKNLSLVDLHLQWTPQMRWISRSGCQRRTASSLKWDEEKKKMDLNQIAPSASPCQNTLEAKHKSKYTRKKWIYVKDGKDGEGKETSTEGISYYLSLV